MHRPIQILVLLYCLIFPKFSDGQCIVIVESSSDYEVAIEISITGISATSPCPWGYNFNIEMDYTVTFSGPDAPASLYTLQGNIACDDFPSNFYNLPNAGGSGSTITGSNPYNPNTDCLTATPESLGCDGINVRIHGPGISDQTVECLFGGTLPISLLSFHANATSNNDVELDWITVSELNNDYFNIEHSIDGENWSSIHERSGAGTSNELINYDFTHSNPANGMNYYRLKQTDFDGQYAYSYIRSVQIGDNANSQSIQIYPNPGKDIITIQASASELSLVEIYDARGKKVISEQSTNNDQTRIVLNISDLAPGIYFVKTRNNMEKLIVN